MTTPTRPKRAAKKGKPKRVPFTPDQVRAVYEIVRAEIAAERTQPKPSEVEELAQVLCGAWGVVAWSHPSSDKESFRREARAALSHLRSKP